MPDTGADLAVTGARVWTQDPQQPWAQALAIRDGIILAVGSDVDIAPHIGAHTAVVDAAGAMIMPGLCEGHAHLYLGGAQAAFELPILPTDGLDAILAKVHGWSAGLGPDEWVVGGIVGATVMDALTSHTQRERLDAAAGGRPVLLRDDSLHNRWVSARTLDLMHVSENTPDPDGGRYARDTDGNLTGVLQELASTIAEGVFAGSLPDAAARYRDATAAALGIMNSYGITSVQDAMTMQPGYDALRALEDAGRLTAHVVASMPVRLSVLEQGTVGDDLVASVRNDPGQLVHPGFVKVFLDGVPMTRTAALLEPYRHTPGHDDTRGEAYWALDDLVTLVDRCYDQGLGAKFHATGDASVRLVLDAVQQVRDRRGPGPRFQIAHVEFIHPDDIARFAALNVVADASPYIWFPSVLQDSIKNQVPAALVDTSWPFRAILDAGGTVIGGSDWPCSAPTPDPWTGMQTMVTRQNPDPSVQGSLALGQAITLEEAIAAFTSAPAEAMGLGGVAGRLKPGYSADFIILDQNLFEADITAVHATRALATYFRGHPVHTAPKVDPA